jgi:hypothetical protein
VQFYNNDGPQRSPGAAAKLLTKDEARRIGDAKKPAPWSARACLKAIIPSSLAIICLAVSSGAQVMSRFGAIDDRRRNHAQNQTCGGS